MRVIVTMKKTRSMNRLVWLEHIAPRFAGRFSMLLLLGAAGLTKKPCNFTRRCNFTTMTP